MKINNNGFIQIPLLLLILAGITIIGGSGYFITKEISKAPAESNDQQTIVQPQQDTSSTAEQTNKEDSVVSESGTQPQTQPLQQNQTNQPQKQTQSIQAQAPDTQQQAQQIQTPVQITPTPQNTQPSQNQTQPTPIKVSIMLGTQDIGETTAQIEWTTSEQTESKLYLSGGGLSSQQHDSQNGYTTTHAVTLSNLQPATDYSFQITATGNNGFMDYAGSFKTRIPAPTLQLSPTDGTKIPLEGSGYKLTWTSTYTKQCTASGDWSGEKSVVGEYILSFTNTGNYTYNLACVGNNGENISKSVSVNVIDTKPKITFYFNGNTTNTYTANVGSSVRMSWEVLRASTCTASGDWNGAKSNYGYQDFVWEVEGGFNYTLTCVNASQGGTNTASVTVTQ